MTLTLRPSRYVIVGRTPYRHPTGRLVRPVLLAASARVFLADLATAERLTGVRSQPLADADERRLFETGLLVPADSDEAAQVVAAGREAAQTARNRVFVIMPSAYCNMGCGYCGQQHQRSATGPGHRAAIAERVTHAARSGRYDQINIRWFGGEPLMGYAIIRDLSDRFTLAADQAGVGYTAGMVTNGALLDLRKLLTLHQRCRIGHIEITLDGPAHMHDTSRPLKRGGGSFEHITTVLRTVLHTPELAGLELSIRTNVGVHNAHLADEFAAGLAAAGLADPRITYYPAPVHPWGNDVSEIALSEHDMAAVELSWLTAYTRHGLHTTLLPGAPKRVVCVAVTPHAEVVAPDGRVYSCTEQPLVPGHADRHLTHLTLLPAEATRPQGQFDDWYDALDANETGCRDCHILPLCGGACPKLWREGSPPCPPIKHNVHQRLDLYALAAGCVPATPEHAGLPA